MAYSRLRVEDSVMQLLSLPIRCPSFPGLPGLTLPTFALFRVVSGQFPSLAADILPDPGAHLRSDSGTVPVGTVNHVNNSSLLTATVMSKMRRIDNQSIQVQYNQGLESLERILSKVRRAGDYLFTAMPKCRCRNSKWKARASFRSLFRKCRSAN